MIQCERCKTINPPEQRYCQKCHKDLLPGEGALVRFSVLIAAGLLTALGVWVLKTMAQGDPLPDLGCVFTSPVYWVFVVVGAPILGLKYALRPTPAHEKFLNRARRHLKIDPVQALNDLNQALELAPEKERSAILKERARLHETLGHTQESIRDRINTIESEGAYQGAEGFAALVGIDRDTFAAGFKDSDIQALIQAQAAAPYGYCHKCRTAVALNEKMRCPIHRRAHISHIRLAVAEDAEKIQAAIHETQKKEARQLLIRRLVALGSMIPAILALAYVLKIGPFKPETADISPPASEQTSMLEQDQDTLASPTAAAIQPATPIPAGPQVFNQNVFSFEIPGDWLFIEESDHSTLINGSLRGIDTDQIVYLGGAYTGGLEGCAECAQVVIVVLNEPAMTGSLSDEQFEAAKQANQETMGDRLFSYAKVFVDGLPAIESHHIGRSETTRLWEYIIVPTEPGLVYLVSMSSAPDTYAQFESIFQNISSTLQIGGDEDNQTSPDAISNLTAVVLIEGLNVRSGPGKDKSAVGTLAKGVTVNVLGKNAAQDWLKITTLELGDGWVSAALVSLRGAMEDLPVITEP